MSFVLGFTHGYPDTTPDAPSAISKPQIRVPSIASHGVWMRQQLTLRGGSSQPARIYARVGPGKASLSCSKVT